MPEKAGILSRHSQKWKCPSCGTENDSRFCPSCGTPKPVQEMFVCECGYCGPVSKFCPECGKLTRKKEYQCECGYMVTSRFCPNCGKPRPENPSVPGSQAQTATVVPAVSVTGIVAAAVNPLTPENKPAAAAAEPASQALKPEAGWTCEKCGKELQTGDHCEECGSEIKKVILFSCSSYMTTNPPRSEGARVYEYSDTELILESRSYGVVRCCYIPADVIAPAYEIIKKYGIDRWKEYENCSSGVMGGSVSVFYKDGEELVGSTMDQMGSAVHAAYGELMQLFHKAAG